ncbi:hypothetical protein STRDD11_02051 [Streptococcus sp. DD11]|uniref:YdcF family protein n=1 Tax=Streptococcus sp. DD11 TaxID=1777879 RepID=UPI000795CEAC|nr:YdcF family protein [Streptococcus sp. DD11]KXT81424.1 hypothetical protein STRDD11_02051 [Streptococcus sp. DD11]
MFLHLFWLLPALLFLLLFYLEPRRLFNAYLLSFSLLVFLLISSGLLIVGLRHLGEASTLTAIALIALLIPVCVILSSVYLIFNGRQMITREGRRLANLLSLFYGLTILFYLASFFLPRAPILNNLLMLANILLLYGTGLYLSYILYGFFCNLFPIQQEPDYIIVLGSGLIGDEVPPLLAQRLDKSRAVYEQFGQRPKLLLSGGKGSDELLSEAQAMARYLTAAGFPEQDLILENKSTTTFENLIFSKKILDDRTKKPYSCLVITNSFHALRAGVYMRKVGLRGRSLGSKTAFYYLPSAWIRETAGLMYIYWKWHVLILAGFLLIWTLRLLAGR